MRSGHGSGWISLRRLSGKQSNGRVHLDQILDGSTNPLRISDPASTTIRRMLAAVATATRGQMCAINQKMGTAMKVVV